MATGIPLPGQPGDSFLKGVDTGSSMFSRIMQPMIEREKQKQQAEQFAQELAIKKQMESRLGQNSGLNKQILQQQLLGLQHKNDPNYEFQQFQALQNMLMGGGIPQSGMVQTPQQQVPTQEMGQGMGMFSPEGMQAAQQQAAPTTQSAPQGQGGMNFDALRQNPFLRGYFKQKFKFDPLAASPQTPEDKQAAALDLFRQKEAIKAENKGGDTATNKVLTQNQQAVQAIDTVIPMVDEFINHPEKVYGRSDFSPAKKAAYNAKTGGMIDLLVAAQSLPQVKESVALVEDQIRRKAGEGTDDYIARLKDFKKDLMTRKEKAVSVVNSKKVDTTSTAPNETKTIGGVKYEKINGEWHEAD